MPAGWSGESAFSPAVSKASVARLVDPVGAFGSGLGPRSVGPLAFLEELYPVANGLLHFLARDASPCRRSAAGQPCRQQQDHQSYPP